jgi:hypothetical protein
MDRRAVVNCSYGIKEMTGLVTSAPANESASGVQIESYQFAEIIGAMSGNKPGLKRNAFMGRKLRLEVRAREGGTTRCAGVSPYQKITDLIREMVLRHFQFALALFRNRIGGGHRPPLQCKGKLELVLFSTISALI